MSTAPQPPAPQQPGFSLGGTLVIPEPLPNVTPYPLRPDEFLSICDGDAAASNSLRDLGFGSFVTGVIAAATLLPSLDWDAAVKQGRHPYFWAAIILMTTAAALATAIIGSVVARNMKQQSAYARQIVSIAVYFGMKDNGHSLLKRLRVRKLQQNAPSTAPTAAT